MEAKDLLGAWAQWAVKECKDLLGALAQWAAKDLRALKGQLEVKGFAVPKDPKGRWAPKGCKDRSEARALSEVKGP